MVAGRRTGGARRSCSSSSSSYVHRRGVEPLPVHYVGKVATACLMYGMPLLFLTTGDGLVADVATACRVGLHHLGHRHLLVVGCLVRRAGFGCPSRTPAGVERVTSPSNSVEPTPRCRCSSGWSTTPWTRATRSSPDRGEQRSVDWRHSVVFAVAIGVTAALAYRGGPAGASGRAVCRSDARRAHRACGRPQPLSWRRSTFGSMRSSGDGRTAARVGAERQRTPTVQLAEDAAALERVGRSGPDDRPRRPGHDGRRSAGAGW